ncbi:MAG: hypothetical protein ABEI86_07275, partial [Halobacteriaceae archaeon]
SLARQGDLSVLQNYLYLSFTDVVERYRHESQQYPWRGELQLAVKQANCLKNAFGEDLKLNPERIKRIEPYQQVALGELRSGGRWRSQRDSQDLPDPDFVKASKHFLQAADQVQSIDEDRYIKYLSKSFRHLATASIRRGHGAAEGWITGKKFHETAIDVISEMASDGTEDSLTQTITETIALHKFKAHEASVIIAFRLGKPDEITEQADKAWELIDAVPVYVETDVLKTAKELSEALQLENSGRIDEAIDLYDEINNPKFDLNNRKIIARMKRELDERNHQNSIDIATKLLEYNHSSPPS